MKYTRVTILNIKFPLLKEKYATNVLPEEQKIYTNFSSYRMMRELSGL